MLTYNIAQYIGLLRGEFHYAVKKNDEILVWALEDYNRKSWPMKHTVSLNVVCKFSPVDVYILAFHPALDA